MKKGEEAAEEYMVGVCITAGAVGILHTLLSESCITKACVAKYWLTQMAASLKTIHINIYITYFCSFTSFFEQILKDYFS